MSEMKTPSLLNRLMSSAWASLAVRRNSLASFGRPPAAVGVVILTGSAWMIGHHTAPVHTQARTVVPTPEASAELTRTRQQLMGARQLIERYQEELAAMDARQATGTEEVK